MKYFKLVLFNIIIIVLASNIYADDYYAGTEGLSGEELVNALHNIIDDHIYYSYQQAGEYVFIMNEEDGYLTCVYSGEQTPMPDPINFQYFNREHTWPQSYFEEGEIAVKKSDMHHLYPTNPDVNNLRANLPFGDVFNVWWTSIYDSTCKHGTNINNEECFEPRDIHKGDAARALFYFGIRYYMELPEVKGWEQEVLKEWHNDDPPDSNEIYRNEQVYTLQENRNPLIDHPEFADLIDFEDFTNAISINNFYDNTLYLYQNYPNPFNPTTTVSFSVAQMSSFVNLEIYNIKGQKIKTFRIQHYEIQTLNQVIWDGKDENGKQVPSGVYLYRLSTNNFQSNIQKMLLMQ
ncbi:MAG: endonuclease [Candidatus Cloacimonetes bacterium]|nr:endonuclease [Candidatus Cloacimonadota bacterium]